MNPLQRKRVFVRKDGNGYPVPGSMIIRKTKPKTNGEWFDITSAVVKNCCVSTESQTSFLIFRNTTASANITAISYTGVNWTGTLANNGFLVLPLPFNTAVTVSITTSSYSGRTITTSKVQGTGTIEAIGSLAALTSEADVSADIASQYLLVLS